MGQCGCRMGVPGSLRMRDACGGMQHRRRRHQRGLAMSGAVASARAVAIIAAVMRVGGRCIARQAGVPRILHRRCRFRRHVAVTGRLVDRRLFNRRSGNGRCSGCRRVGAARVRRCHGRADAVRHQGEAEQHVQQER